MSRMTAITPPPPPPLNPRLWLRRHFIAAVMMLAAFFVLAEGNLPRAETHRMEEPCGIALIGACLPRRGVAWERTQGVVVEATRGFTLLEIAIVLMVIGLIVGGILWGAEMIGQAATRAQISQVEKFDAAVNTFVTKYGYLPGDIPDPYASQFGFQPRGKYAGQGDGNGVIEGNNNNCPGCNYGFVYSAGETVVFWVDLSAANMLDGSFTTASSTVVPSATISGTYMSLYFPPAKVGRGNYIYPYSQNSINYFGISAISSIAQSGSCLWCLGSTPGLTVNQAFNIDKKIDDGYPASGRLQAKYVDYASFPGQGIGSAPNATPDSSSTCYNNTTKTYSTSINNGAYVNCALSFQMQGAAR